MRRLPLAVAAVVVLTASAPAAAVPAPELSVRLPAPGATAAAARTWLVGGRPSPRTRALARTAGAREVVAGTYRVAAPDARAFARTLRAADRLTFAEPDRRSAFAAVPDDPIPAPWRDASFDRALDPPPVTPDSPFLALIDEQAQTDHPEFTGDPNVSSVGGSGVTASHGTQTLGTAVAPVNGVGVVGAYPGARAVNFALPERIRCSDSARGIRAATRAGAAVINMSYGSADLCITEYLALENAVRRGVVLVAAGGNDGDRGNPFEFPASLPHVLTVGALQPNGTQAAFSNTNGALDLLAPGVSIIAPTPVDLDTEDGAADGYERVDGTSFAAPIVSAAALWLRAARPDLTPDQAAQVLRLSATDLGREGYDSDTGYGALDMANALVKAPPIVDPAEPNESFAIVNGDALAGGAAPAIWRGGAPVSFQALVDYYEDPGDVYRIRIPGRARATVTLKPDFGNPDLFLYDGAAQRFDSKRHLVARSRRGGTKPDRVRVRNGARTTRTAYVYVRAGERPTLDSRYSLEVR